MTYTYTREDWIRRTEELQASAISAACPRCWRPIQVVEYSVMSPRCECPGSTITWAEVMAAHGEEPFGPPLQGDCVTAVRGSRV